MDNVYKIKKDMTDKINVIYDKHNKILKQYSAAEKKPYYVALDLETIGLPQFKTTNGDNNNRFYDPKDISKYDASRVVQVGYIVYTKDGKVVCGKKFIIKPTDFIIVPSSYHNITEDVAKTKGVSFEYFLKKFKEDIQDVREFIGHNVLFDINILASEIFRVGDNSTAHNILKLKINCTMEMSKKLCGLMMNTLYGQRLKSPSLAEAYKIIIGRDLKNHHDAYCDALHSSHIFFVIRNNNNNNSI